ncbi:MAG: zinc ribbon domain-containing protein [Eubacterium sp.]|nr:zinc ribbon domain-containing protein [Eubacterium sp.]
MYCENCGKKLIRGYQFCMECGTPVPPEVEEEEENEDAQANEQSASEQPSGEMPGIQPIGNEEGTLVFCPTCGMRMQKSTDHCEKCGMKLNANGSSGVPLVNTDPLGGEFGGISDSDLARIDNFVNNSGLGGDISYDVSGGSDDMGGLGGGLGGIGGLGGGDLNSEIEALNQQFANLNATSSDMPAISAPAPEPEPQPEPVPQEPDLGTLSRRVEDFSMEAGMPETQFLSESGLPVINGGEMAEPDEPMQLEQNYDDINIDITAPAPTAVAEPEAPAYTEPEAPAYAEPEAPAYTEPEAPAYTEPEAPAYTEPEAPAYTEPETPAYTEPETPAYTEPEAPAYTEPEAPAYTEPEAPAYTEPEFTQPRRPEPEPAPAAESSENDGADLGKLVYCRNCGQDMYEKEAVCKNCGSPNKWNIKPLKKNVSGSATKIQKQPTKLFGIFPIPTVIGAAVVVVGVIALIVATSTANKSEDLVSQPATPTTASTVPDTPVEADENAEVNVPDVPDVSDVSDVSSVPEEVNPIVTNESQPEPAATEEAAKPATAEVSGAESSRPSDTSSSPAATPAVTTRPNTSVTTRPNSVATSPAVTTTPKPAVTAREPAVVSTKPSATVTNEDKQREKILDAFEAVSAEVGKLHLYSQATSYAIDAGFTKTKFTSGMTSVLSGGKSNVSSLVKNAKPSSSELSSAYSSLQKLYDLYTDYYTYVTGTSDSGSKYTSTADSKLSSFNSAAKSGLSFKSLQTGNQTSSDKSRQYADMLSNAASAASNAASQFNTVKNSVADLKSSKYESDVMGVIYNDKTSAIMKAAGYAQVVSNYDEMMSGAPAEYSSAKSSLTKAASDLDGMLGVFIDAAYNDLSGFKSEFSSYKTSVDKAVAAVNKAV